MQLVSFATFALALSAGLWASPIPRLDIGGIPDRLIRIVRIAATQDPSPPIPRAAIVPGDGAAQERSRPSILDIFAHYMVGLADGHSPAHWAAEIAAAQASGLDGFALNIGPRDPWTAPQLRHAYRAAEGARPRDFALFLSFDMAAGAWTVGQVAGLIGEFGRSSAQFRVGDRPLVSTFEGPAWAHHWPAVRAAVGGIFLVPDWSSLGPRGVRERLGGIEGAFSWCAWPRAGQHRMDSTEDILYRETLGEDRVYMMGVSPCFYTHLPHWGKNWYASSESLWYDRWRQVLEIMPDFVQIITWNDFGESSYIHDPVRPGQVVSGAEKYVANVSHAAFRAVLPFFVAAFKAGTLDVYSGHADRAIAWYRTTPARCAGDGGTRWGQDGCASAADGARDVVSVLAIAAHPAPLSVAVTIGGEGRTFGGGEGSRVAYYELPFDGRVGPVCLSLGGRTTVGPAISEVCHPCGHVLFNPVAIEVEAVSHAEKGVKGGGM
ncbi:hypothetical protein P8C59_008977 [Phyllachora maydis]|uniref:Uncharacterized protein n=1 Tax=Phyllachora maydis TaxID=1825666 RepID=A0AAD9IDK4_9PEZI|nr:hypothetical protein P8C59_008977 [Phyllachora maydis]